jgi:hypothetical protein
MDVKIKTLDKVSLAEFMCQKFMQELDKLRVRKGSKSTACLEAANFYRLNTEERWRNPLIGYC